MITIVDYGSCNVGSIVNMLKKIGAESCVASRPDDIVTATKIILPGVGAFDNGIKNLHSRGFTEPLTRRVMEDRIPVLGLCLGAQLLTTGSEEGQLPGLGWLNARTVKFRFPHEEGALKVPHMGWNTVHIEKPSALLLNLPEPARFYFVHSYHLIADPGLIVTSTNYGYSFASGVQQGHIAGFQFHPEKSHKFGMQLFRNFVNDFY